MIHDVSYVVIERFEATWLNKEEFTKTCEDDWERPGSHEAIALIEAIVKLKRGGKNGVIK